MPNYELDSLISFSFLKITHKSKSKYYQLNKHKIKVNFFFYCIFDKNLEYTRIISGYWI